MPSTFWPALDWILGIGGWLAAITSLIWLVGAWLRPTRQRTRRAVLLALVLAVTVAQPFGIVAHRVARMPANAHAVAPYSVHAARAFGAIPLFPFAVYRLHYPPIGDNWTHASLRVRSWFWLPILTNATHVTGLCGGIVTLPCWDPSLTGEHNALTLASSGGDYYLRMEDFQSTRGGYLTWKLTPGIAYVPGLIYWLLLAVLIPLVVRDARRPQPAADA